MRDLRILFHVFILLFCFRELDSQTVPNPSNPSYPIPTIAPKQTFQDLLSPAPKLTRLGYTNAIKEEINEGSYSQDALFYAVYKDSNSFKRRYLEREWQELYEYDLNPKNKMYRENILMERALREQFQMASFREDFGTLEYTETNPRRFAIIFFLSLPLTVLYSLGGITLYKISQKQTLQASGGDFLISLSLGTIVSSVIAVLDNKNFQNMKKNIPTTSTQEENFNF